MGKAIVNGIASFYLQSASVVTQYVTDQVIEAAFSKEDYRGVYYTSYQYISGRCMKIVTKTYWDSARNQICATYTNYIKW